MGQQWVLVSSLYYSVQIMKRLKSPDHQGSVMTAFLGQNSLTVYWQWPHKPWEHLPMKTKYNQQPLCFWQQIWMTDMHSTEINMHTSCTAQTITVCLYCVLQLMCRRVCLSILQLAFNRVWHTCSIFALLYLYYLSTYLSTLMLYSLCELFYCIFILCYWCPVSCSAFQTIFQRRALEIKNSF